VPGSPLNIPVAEQGSGHPDTTSAIVALGKRLAPTTAPTP
jgi:hypothetical protein